MQKESGGGAEFDLSQSCPRTGLREKQGAGWLSLEITDSYW